MEDIPVAKDPEWFDRSAFPDELNARIAATFVDMSSAAGSGQRVLHALTSLMSGKPLYTETIPGSRCAGGVLRLRPVRTTPSMTVMPTPGRLPSSIDSRIVFPGACCA